MATEALILKQGMRATLSIGAWSANVDASELRAWAAHSGLEVLHLGGNFSRMILQDDADCEFAVLTWSDASIEQ